MLLKFMALLISLVPMVSAQQNVLHQGDSGNSQSVIVTARTRAFLSCESGDIVVKVNFTQPFRGLMYAHRSRNSPCRIHGTGGYYYQLRIPLKGCGTWQETPRVFVNNVTIRFHPALELEEDETKTVVCRYPPPLTPPPGTIQVIEPPTSGPNPGPTRVGTARLSEVEILIIICLLLFLSLLTLGIGIAYFCLKRRNIHIVRKSTTVSSAPPSQITRLSSSNVPPPSSLLSSVLGHTVRIPRAVPYSAQMTRTSVLSSPDHHYEEYPVSTSTASGESTETSVSSSSEDAADVSKNLLFRKAGGRSLLSIPKAILRKTGPKRLRAEPTVHHHYSKANTASVGTSIRRPEMEDQTIITVLDSEGPLDDDQRYWSVRNGISESERQMSRQTIDLHKSDASKKSIPVYAQVDKNKKAASKSQEINLGKLNISKPPLKAPRMPGRPPPPLLGAARRQRARIAAIPEESSTSEEISKNTTVTTSVRREITESRIISPTLSQSNDTVDGLSDLSGTDTESRLSQSENSALQSANHDIILHQPPKNILIQDVSDVYLTTTVETESREFTTRVSRDTVEEHVRTNSITPSKDVADAKPSPKLKAASATDASKSPELKVASPTDVSPSPELKVASPTDARLSPELKTPSATTSSPELKTVSPTDNWNVVIRQRQPPPNVQASSTDSDTASESKGVDKNETPQVKPMFDVKIRTIPPDVLVPKEPQGMVTIPPLEMPQTISKLKEALMPKTAESSPATKLPETESQDDKSDDLSENKDKPDSPQRTVRWVDDGKSSARDKDSTVSSSDSFQSAASLRERSSSEVLEVAPTLSSQRRGSGHPSMLERSTSEIVTNPEEHVRWVGGVVPVLESLSPEFLANIPVVLQGGFFNQQRTPSPKDKEQHST